MPEPGDSIELDSLALRLGKPAGSLQAFAALDPAQRSELIASVDRTLSARQEQLDHALQRMVPWPLRAPLLRWMRR